MSKHPVEIIAETVGGTITEAGSLPDGSGFAVMSMPLPKKHWIYKAPDTPYEAPPMPFRMGTADPRYYKFNEMIRAAARYAVKAATMNGEAMDFDPDAMVQNFLVGMMGYHTPDALSSDGWANPSPAPEPYPGNDDSSSFGRALLAIDRLIKGEPNAADKGAALLKELKFHRHRR